MGCEHYAARFVKLVVKTQINGRAVVFYKLHDVRYPITC